MLQSGQFEFYRRQQFAVTCELPEKPLQIADPKVQTRIRINNHKNNDRLRLLEAIWPATFSPIRSGFLFFFLVLNLFSFLINRSKFIG